MQIRLMDLREGKFVLVGRVVTAVACREGVSLAVEATGIAHC